MIARPMLAWKILDSSPPVWFGRKAREIPDGDYLRFRACVIAAQRLLGGGEDGH